LAIKDTYPDNLTEEQWRAREDASTLARAEAIKTDSSRHQKARSAAQVMLKDEREDAALLSKVAGRKTRVPSVKTTQRRRTSTSTGFNVFQKLKKE